MIRLQYVKTLLVTYTSIFNTTVPGSMFILQKVRDLGDTHTTTFFSNPSTNHPTTTHSTAPYHAARHHPLTTPPSPTHLPYENQLPPTLPPTYPHPITPAIIIQLKRPTSSLPTHHLIHSLDRRSCFPLSSHQTTTKEHTGIIKSAPR